MLANMGFGRLMWLLLLLCLARSGCDEPATERPAPPEAYRRHFSRPYQEHYHRNHLF
jgi:hypothetical protein